MIDNVPWGKSSHQRGGSSTQNAKNALAKGNCGWTYPHLMSMDALSPNPCRMWKEFGSKYTRPDLSSIESYLAEFEANQVAWGCDKSYEPHSKPRLIDEMMIVMAQLQKVCKPVADDEERPLEADKKMNTTINEVLFLPFRVAKGIFDATQNPIPML